MYPDLSDYDEVFDPDHFAPPRKIRCDNWANPPCSYTPNECSPKVTDVESLKGFCGFQDATTGMYGDNFDRCWDCPDKPEDCDWAIGNCLQECFGYEGSGCYGSECENSVQNLEESGSDLALDNSTEDPYAGTVPYPSSDPSSDPGSDPEFDNSTNDPMAGSDPGHDEETSISPSASESETSFETWSGQKRCFFQQSENLRCGRLPRTPRSKTADECTQECADEQHCKYAIWHSGKYVNKNEPDLLKPWSRSDTRPVCYLFSFTSHQCKWDGYRGHLHPNFGKYMNSIIPNLPETWDRYESDWQDDLVAGPDYFYDFEQDGDYWNPAAACQPGYGMHVDGEYSGNILVSPCIDKIAFR